MQNGGNSGERGAAAGWWESDSKTGSRNWGFGSRGCDLSFWLGGDHPSNSNVNGVLYFIYLFR